MGVSGRQLDEAKQAEIKRLADQKFSRRAIAGIAGVCKRTVDKYAIAPAKKSGGAIAK